MKMLLYLLLLSGFCSFAQSALRGYLLVQQPKTWDDAITYCQDNYNDIAVVAYGNDWSELQKTVVPYMTSQAWVGLYNDIYSWRWSYKNENVSYVQWKSGEPDNSGGKDECGVFNQGTWQDSTCTIYLPTFCFNESATGADRFIYYDFVWKTWLEAQAFCRQKYTDLATIQSLDEMNELNLMVPSYFNPWIGLYRESWKWLDGSAFSPTSIYWMTGKPDLTGKGRPCAAVGTDSKLDDRLCSDLLPFICVYIAKTQIVKLEVKSLQNLNDPAVMDSISQWITQKLNNRGVMNAKLKWRVQPDGNVFTPNYVRETNPQQIDCSAQRFNK
ncbi:C-type mannose receptor 2-like [Misgurnus anguillicaudatus]|uniref:C-type mannose receptor 2-like n=1 Tax=Misgurnus anguillicaudatus TaxID=75329 RepID=UPI003CCF8DC2